MKTKLVFSTNGDVVLCNHAVLLDEISPCNHEEGDTRIFVHVLYSLNDFSSVVIKTVNTDTVVLAIDFFHRLNIEKILIELGTGNNTKFVVASLAQSSFRHTKHMKHKI